MANRTLRIIPDGRVLKLCDSDSSTASKVSSASSLQFEKCSDEESDGGKQITENYFGSNDDEFANGDQFTPMITSPMITSPDEESNGGKQITENHLKSHDDDDDDDADENQTQSIKRSNDDNIAEAHNKGGFRKKLRVRYSSGKTVDVEHFDQGIDIE